MRQARIVDALEEEKKKISRELEEMQRKRALRENQTPRHGESLTVTTVPSSPRDYRLKSMSDLASFYVYFQQGNPTLSCADLRIRVFLSLCLFIIGPL